MRPGPRVQASIDLLDLIYAGDDAADRTVAAYFRRRRYAGSKDRAAVTELIYSVLRRQAWLEWRLSNAGVGAQGGTQRGDERLPVALVFWYMPDSGDPKVGALPLACARSH